MKKQFSKNRKILLRLFIFSVVSLSFLSLQANSFIGGRTDFRDETIYFLMTTRFYDGDPSNNVFCWDGKKPSGDPEWRGDFKGLIQKLDYIKALGFTAVWITPVVENASGFDYHGYHAMNFSKVDDRYNSEDVKFQDLIDAVHAKGMKIILDVVFNHTGNFGEDFLAPMFEKEGDLSTSDCMQLHPKTILPADYHSYPAAPPQGQKGQYDLRLERLKNSDGQNHDSNNYYHHTVDMSWESPLVQWSSIAGDCVDLNTENPTVYNYIIDAYSQFIEMGVDGFRIDTGKHISRLVFNKIFNPAFMKKAKEVGNDNFFMFSEVCTLVSEVWNHNMPCISAPFYTWKESKEYAWSEDPSEYQNKQFYGRMSEFESATTNWKSCSDHWNDNSNGIDNQPISQNAFLDGNKYRPVDYSKKADLSVIDFPMHHNFIRADNAMRIALEGDKYYSDATFNVVYVDSHDYGPNGSLHERFNGSQDTWAENLSLMYTFRGIPCLYYGSEIEFKKGITIDEGPKLLLENSGRAYFGNHIEGSVNVTDFANYSNATGAVATTLNHPLAKHIQRLSAIRMAIPALRKGQYSVEGVDNPGNSLSFKRRYTDENTDSYVLVAVSNEAKFTNIENGTYVDAVTGHEVTVTTNSLNIPAPGKGNVRIYVLNTAKTPAPGKVGVDGVYLKGEGGGEGGDPSDPDPDPNPGTGITIKWKLKDGVNWSNMYIHYWGNGQSEWPGEQVTIGADGWYSKTFSNTPGGFLLTSSSNGPQTEDISGISSNVCLEISSETNNESKHLVNSVDCSGGSTDPDPDPDPDPNPDPENPILYPDEYAVFFEKPANWGDNISLYVYHDSKGELLGNWDSNPTMTSLGNNVYKYTFTVSISDSDNYQVLFKDGSNQIPGSGSPGWIVKNGAYYTINGQDRIIEPSTSTGMKLIGSEEFNIYAYNGDIYIESPFTKQIDIIYIDGRIVRRVDAQSGTTIVSGLSKGLYIIEGKKVFLW